MREERIYFDYAASTPIDPEVLRAMKPYFGEEYGNPGSLHSFGQEVLKAVDFSRETIAKTIGADFREIIFTGSATEANNLALRGAVKKFISINQPHIRINQRPRLIILAIEHESILETAKDLERDGVEVIYLPVDKNGLVDLEKLEKSLNKETVLVSVMYANNEIGTIQPIFEIAEIIREFKNWKLQITCLAGRQANNKLQTNPKFPPEADQPLAGKIQNHVTHYNLPTTIYPFFHTDAVQAFQYLDCDVDKLGVDLMTLSAHKIYGPKGVGTLYMRNLKVLEPIITGGGQEFGFRSGTENVAAIVGFAKAAESVLKNRKKELKRMLGLRNYFWRKLKQIYPTAELNSPTEKNLLLPNILNIYFPGFKAEDLLIKFDMVGIAVSAGSACRARSPEPSHVLRALGLPENRISQSIRFSFGRFTSKKEINEAFKRIKRILG